MSIRKTILLLNVNYIPVVFFWMASFNQGPFALLIMLPVSILCLTANYLLSEGRRSAFLWCLNLIAAEALGIALHNYLFLNFSGGNEFGIWNAVFEFLVMLLVLLPGAFLVARLNEKRYRRQASGAGLRVKEEEPNNGDDKEDMVTGVFLDEEPDLDEEDEDGDMYDSEPEGEEEDWDEDLLSHGIDREIDDEINDGYPAAAGRGGYSAPNPKKGRRVIIKNK